MQAVRESAGGRRYRLGQTDDRNHGVDRKWLGTTIAVEIHATVDRLVNLHKRIADYHRQSDQLDRSNLLGQVVRVRGRILPIPTALLRDQ